MIGVLIYLNQLTTEPSDLPIPIKISLIDKNGSLIRFKIDNSELNIEHVHLFSKSNDNIKISPETLGRNTFFVKKFFCSSYLENRFSN